MPIIWVIVGAVILALLIIAFLWYLYNTASGSLGGGLRPTPGPVNPCPGLKAALDRALAAADPVAQGTADATQIQALMKAAQDALDAYTACLGPADRATISANVDLINAGFDTFVRAADDETKALLEGLRLKMPP